MFYSEDNFNLQIPLSSCRSFMYMFVQLIVRYYPSAFHLIVNWLIEVIYFMEESDSFYFPDEAITFLDDIMKSVENNFTADYFETISNEDNEALTSIKAALNDIKVLTSYRIHVPLEEYMNKVLVLLLR